MSVIETLDKQLELPYDESDFGYTEVFPSYRVDLRNPKNELPDRFFNANLVSDWSRLTWKDVGKPYEVKTMSVERTDWERDHGGKCL